MLLTRATTLSANTVAFSYLAHSHPAWLGTIAIVLFSGLLWLLKSPSQSLTDDSYNCSKR